MTPTRRHQIANRASYLSIALGLLAVGAVLCFRFPQYLTTPDLRAVYPVDVLRGLLAGGLIAGLCAGAAGCVLHPRRRFGWIGLGLGALALSLGGWWVPTPEHVETSRFLGLDWLVLDFFGVALIFVPLERLFVRLRAQKVFRRGWATDVLHYATSHLSIGVTVLLITAPGYWLASRLELGALQDRVSALPLWLQVPMIIALADLAQYGIHRAFHEVPVLWRFHQIHHSSQEMDWLAGSRLHLVDIVVTRGLTLVPLTLLGFADTALHVYLVFIAAQAVFNHANVRFELRWLSWLLATPLYHHWHHNAELGERGVNYAVSLPVIDRLFGTHHLPPGQWPARYGIEGNPISERWLDQVIDPFVGFGSTRATAADDLQRDHPVA